VYEQYVESGLIRFILQSNFGFNDARADAPTVVARSQLAGYPPQYVRLIQEALDSNDYRELVRTSDIMLIPYDPGRYYARSSGVLVEALTAGIPVIVPGGSWMADQIQAESRTYHLRLASSAPKVRTVAGSSLTWRNRSGPASRPYRGEILAFGGRSSRSFTSIEVDDLSTHVLLRFRFAVGTPPGTYANVEVEQLDASDGSIGRRVALLRALDEGPCTMLVALNPGCVRLSLELHDAFYEAAATVTDLHVDFLSLGMRGLRQPREAVGVTYASTSTLADALRELTDCYPIYRDSALEFADRWVQRHSPERLVAELGEVARTTWAAQTTDRIAAARA
jgi:hypothetical protein